jgi:hypothetical protein
MIHRPAQRSGIEDTGHAAGIGHRGQQERRQKDNRKAVGSAYEASCSNRYDDCDQHSVLSQIFRNRRSLWYR